MIQINSRAVFRRMIAFNASNDLAGDVRLPSPEYTSLQLPGDAQQYALVIWDQERLCIDLEILADQLPHRIDTLAAGMLADALEPTLWACQDLEERHVFPTILQLDASLGPTVARLRAEHVEDEDHAALVSETIMHFIRNPQAADADRLGYLIRGLFLPLKRHSAFDRNVMLPLYLRAQATL
ncbi:hypothetical protein MLD63_17500 [Paracoccus sp. TK19116]|uniref:Hemerythrin domain-containing protein n=1 Tax=Paracoccus albicereus TaxID=2922394 RepID=A0ABT1MV74_9RHOB|nr:hypothetical protein [Paracoccus albicereus]MCQ0972217.1 hypothetical protein [Paracoccus albicereus]